MPFDVPRTVLAVDDDVHVLTAHMKRLSQAGYRVRPATNAADALEAVREERVDAVLLDVEMPGEMDGLDLAAILHKDPLSAGIPIIFVTGRAHQDFPERSRQVGAKYFVSKPYDVDLLLRVLDGIFARDELGEAQRLSHVKRRQPVDDRPVYLN